jgi:hypothetical protein
VNYKVCEKGFGLTEAQPHHLPRHTGKKNTKTLNQNGQSICRDLNRKPEHKDKLFIPLTSDGWFTLTQQQFESLFIIPGYTIVRYNPTVYHYIGCYCNTEISARSEYIMG